MNWGSIKPGWVSQNLSCERRKPVRESLNPFCVSYNPKKVVKTKVGGKRRQNQEILEL
jgi:hypothetical protein